MTNNNQNGAYVIQEQGDLGLGTIAIDSKYKYLAENGEVSTPEFSFGEKEKEKK